MRKLKTTSIQVDIGPLATIKKDRAITVSKIPGHISTSELQKYNFCGFAYSSRKSSPLN